MITFHDCLWNMTIYDQLWQAMLRHDNITFYDKIWQDMARYDKIWQDMQICDKIWQAVIWKGLMCYGLDLWEAEDCFTKKALADRVLGRRIIINIVTIIKILLINIFVIIITDCWLIDIINIVIVLIILIIIINIGITHCPPPKKKNLKKSLADRV